MLFKNIKNEELFYFATNKNSKISSNCSWTTCLTMNNTVSSLPSTEVVKYGIGSQLHFLKDVLLFICVIVGTISSLRTAIMLTYLLRCKWINSDFIFLMVTFYNLTFCLLGIYNSVYAINDSRPVNYYEILILGIQNASYFPLYATALLITALEIWLAVQTPLWHRIQVTKKRVIICCLLCTLICVLASFMPELISPGNAFIYSEELSFADISTEGIGLLIFGLTWLINITIESIITFALALMVFCIVKKNSRSAARIQRIGGNRTIHFRKMLLTFIHITRFSILWSVYVVASFIFYEHVHIISIFVCVFYLNCIGDGNLQSFIIPRYRKLRADLVRKFSCESKPLSYAFAIFL